MKRSTDRILTTHVGSLPRPDSLLEASAQVKKSGDRAAFDQKLPQFVAETVKLTAGITRFSENVMAREYDLTIAMHTKDCRFNPESLATLKRSFSELKLVEGETDMSKLYTEAFVPK